MRKSDSVPPVRTPQLASTTVYPVLVAISCSHLMNDTIQALLPSIYPLLKEAYQLSFTQLGLITLTFQGAASLLQPLVGVYTDRKPMPYSLAIGMTMTLIGLVALSFSSSFLTILCSAVLIGSGSAIFHPEASRIAYMAAGKRRGLAQSLFQVGGNAGSAIGPLLAAWIIVPHGQRAILLFCLLALLAVVVLAKVGIWQRENSRRMQRQTGVSEKNRLAPEKGQGAYSRKTVIIALSVLMALVFSKYVYLASLTSYYTFYLIDRFGLSIQGAQYHLFLLLASVAAGTIIGGPVGDRFGRKRVIWGSILGVAPFSIALPYASLGGTAVLSVLIGMILASAFSAILVYAQELVPGKIGMIAGLFFGLAFGIAGIGSAILGKLADIYSVYFVFQLCSFLPLIGLLTVFLPDIERG